MINSQSCQVWLSTELIETDIVRSALYAGIMILIKSGDACMCKFLSGHGPNVKFILSVIHQIYNTGEISFNVSTFNQWLFMLFFDTCYITAQTYATI